MLLRRATGEKGVEGGCGEGRQAMVLKAEHRRWLLELTALPTAAGYEGAVAAWVRRWVMQRPWARIRTDGAGNLVLLRRGVRSRRPVVLAAHMDHPALVVKRVGTGRGTQKVWAEFRGGVRREFFTAARVRLVHEGSPDRRGRVQEYRPAGGGLKRPVVVVELAGEGPAAAGDIVRWDLPPTRVRGRRLAAPACDDLAGVAAALAAWDALAGSRKAKFRGDVRVLLTRAEEVGFIGAIAACQRGTIPAGARVIALENSKALADAPLGAGPVVRVGDKTSSFDPGLTYRCAQVAAKLAARDKRFKWQRKLMPGGTCEASAYQSYGYTATCLCLPLENYHNMDEKSGRIASEVIDLGDFAGLVRLLVAVSRSVSHGREPGLKERLEGIFEQGRGVL